jgi:Uma2 family endonuclease
VDTLQAIKQAILRLSAIERESIARWLGGDTDDTDAVAEPAVAYGTQPMSRPLTADEYLEFEQTAALRHEFVGGTLYAMSGCSRSHNRIAVNLVAAFHVHLRGGACSTFSSDFKLKLKVGEDDFFYYPDVMIACRKEDVHDQYLQHPKLIMEILSPSTERIDRREKALNYRQIPNLEEYVLVTQNRPHLEIQRRADGWLPTVLTSLNAIAEFRSVGLSLPLTQIYEDVPNIRTAPVE